jgi:H+/Cl- antiporter ClcA
LNIKGKKDSNGNYNLTIVRFVRFLYRITQRSLSRIKQNDELKTATLQSLPFWIASIITGLLAVFYSEVFHWVEKMHEEIEFLHNWTVFIFIPAAFIVSWFLVHKYCRSASGSGIPQLLAGIEMSSKKGKGKKVNALLSLRMIFIKIASSVAMLLGGGSIGREGPTIQIAGGIFNTVNKYIPVDWPKINRKLMLISGGAAGLAAAFNTPLGGIVFAIEELGKTSLNAMRTHVFVAVIIAGLTSQVFLGSYLYLGMPKLPGLTGWGMFYVVIASILAGAFGHLFCKGILKTVKWKNKLKTNGKKFLWVLVCGVLFATLVFFTGNNTVGSGKPLMTGLLFNADASLPWHTFPSRFMGTIITYISGGAGGVFAPSLAIGASLGDAIVSIFSIPEFKNLIIIVCMIGFMSGVTHAPFTSFILVLEMTDRHTAVFPMMLAAVIALAVSRSFDRKSLYEHLTENYVNAPDIEGSKKIEADVK